MVTNIPLIDFMANVILIAYSSNKLGCGRQSGGSMHTADLQATTESDSLLDVHAR
jgi:hypothetical protein